MTMGEGGAIHANDPKLKRFVESFRNWGRDCWHSSGHDNTCQHRFSQQFGELLYGFWVGVYPGMTTDMLKFVIQQICAFVRT